MVTEHCDVPVQSPLHAANWFPTSGVADSATVLPEAKLKVHVLPQEMPAGTEVIRPVPVPDLVAATENPGANVAPTVLAASIVSVHEVVPLQGPDQPEK
jgi:hypothetical protein